MSMKTQLQPYNVKIIFSNTLTFYVGSTGVLLPFDYFIFESRLNILNCFRILRGGTTINETIIYLFKSTWMQCKHKL